MNALRDPAGHQQLARRRAVDLPAHALGRVWGHGHSPIEQRYQVVRLHLGGHRAHKGSAFRKPADESAPPAINAEETQPSDTQSKGEISEPPSRSRAIILTVSWLPVTGLLR